MWNIVYIEFLEEFGDLPAIAPVGRNMKTIAIAGGPDSGSVSAGIPPKTTLGTYIAGTKENLEVLGVI